MSDFSAAYHLKTDNKQDVLDLLTRAELTGYLFQPVNGWVTFVTEIDEFSADSKITDSNKGILLFFNRTSDFLGWGFNIFEDATLIGKYSIFEDEDENLKITNTTENQILSKIVETSKINSLNELLNPPSSEVAYEKGDYEFSKIVGLENIEWTSFMQIDCNVEDYKVEKVG
jgi:hypothetical protein